MQDFPSVGPKSGKAQFVRKVEAPPKLQIPVKILGTPSNGQPLLVANNTQLPELKLDQGNIKFATVGLTAPNRSKQAAFQTVGINRNHLQKIE